MSGAFLRIAERHWADCQHVVDIVDIFNDGFQAEEVGLELSPTGDIIGAGAHSRNRGYHLLEIPKGADGVLHAEDCREVSAEEWRESFRGKRHVIVTVRHLPDTESTRVNLELVGAYALYG